MAFEIPQTGFVSTPRGTAHSLWQPVEHWQIAFNQLPQQFKKDPNLFNLLMGPSACFALVCEAVEGYTYRVRIVNDDGSVSSVISYVALAGDTEADIAAGLIAAINSAGIGVQALASEVSTDKFFIRSTNSGETWTFSAGHADYLYQYLRVWRLGLISEIAFVEYLLWDLFPSVLGFYPEKWGEVEEIRDNGSGLLLIKSTDHGLSDLLNFWNDASGHDDGIPIYIAKTFHHDTPDEQFAYITTIVDDNHFVVDYPYDSDEDIGVWMYPGDVDPNRGRYQGVQLDLVGNILGVPRLDGELDCNYIMALMAKVHCDSSSGTIPDMIGALSMLYPNSEITITPLYPAAVRMKVIDNPGIFQGRIKMMRNTQPTGVGLEINTVSSSNPFRMALQGIITIYSDNGLGGTTVRSADHGLSDGDTVEISDSHGYDGSYVIFNVTEDTFDIAHVYVGSYYYLTQDLWIRTARADGMGGFGDTNGIYTDGGLLSSIWISI